MGKGLHSLRFVRQMNILQLVLQILQKILHGKAGN